VLYCLVGAVAVWTGGGVSASDTVQTSCQQRRMTSVQLGHRNALVPDLISLPALELVDTAGEHPMDSGMWVTVVPVLQ